MTIEYLVTKINNDELITIKELLNFTCCIDFLGNVINDIEKIEEIRTINFNQIGLKTIPLIEDFVNNVSTIDFSLNEIKILDNFHRLKTFKSLKRISFEKNKISEIKNLKYLNSFKKLKGLSFKSNSITDISEFNELKNRNLKQLNLSYNQISKIEGLDNLINLNFLNINNNNISKIEGLNNLILYELILNNNQIKTFENVNIENLVSLELLNNPLKYNKIKFKKKNNLYIKTIYHKDEESIDYLNSLYENYQIRKENIFIKRRKFHQKIRNNILKIEKDKIKKIIGNSNINFNMGNQENINFGY